MRAILNGWLVVLAILMCCLLLSSVVEAQEESPRGGRAAGKRKRAKFHNYDGAAMMLVSGSDWKLTHDRKCYFNASLSLLETNWRPSNEYPLILMNDMKWKATDMKAIRKRWPGLDIMFASVHDYVNINSPQSKDSPKDPKDHDINYKKMRSFFVRHFLDVPLLQDFQYLLRIDSDSCVMNPINFDIFAEMKAKKATYAYHGLYFDSNANTKGLNDFADEYVQQNNLQYSNPPLREAALQFRQVLMFATHFEVIDTFRYKQPDILGFTNAIIESNNIFTKRWNDATLRFLLAELFYDKNEVMRLCEFTLQHSSWTETVMCEYRHSQDALLKHIIAMKNKS